jgi:acyl-CoA thioester hydrolase
MIYDHIKTVLPEWIEYNAHMQDAYYGLIFSKAVDALQDEVGLDQAYRKKMGCTIYLAEEHKFF